MDQLAEMRVFVAVLESGGITKAAARLGIAKSAVSRRLADLEGRLSVQLIRRSTRRMNPTDTGQAFYERCKRILADIDEAEQAVSRTHGALSGRLRVAVPLSFGLAHLSPAIDAFLRSHPDLSFDLDLNDRQVDLVAEGFDVAVRIAELADSTLIARRLAPVRHVVCASPDYLARRGVPKRAVELAEHDCLVYGNAPSAGVWGFVDPQGRPGRVRVPARVQANNGDCLRQAAEEGHGIILGPSFILFRAIEEGRLTPLLMDHRWLLLYAHAVYPGARHLSRRVRTFVDFLAERFDGVPYWDRCLAGVGSASSSGA
ncbi:MAG: LysR family transcriptional regulator [Thiohalocapsa sp.]|nr:LysR family transcriptional regulator [Thiohalocapsa sp.]